MRARWFDSSIQRREAVALFLMLAAAAEAFNGYDNTPGGDVFVECPPGEGMNFVSSSFTSSADGFTSSGGGEGDRLWDWDCRKVFIFCLTVIEPIIIIVVVVESIKL